MTSAPRTATAPRRTVAQGVSLLAGVGFLLVAILGFIASGMSMEADPDVAPKILGMFPVNVLHNCVHLAFGIWGLAAARTPAAARTYCLAAGVIYLVLTALGYFVPNGFGLVPLGGADIPLHLVLGVLLTGVGFAAKDRPVGAV
jgi:Domain of unknown function (DUF4383)